MKNLIRLFLYLFIIQNVLNKYVFNQKIDLTINNFENILKENKITLVIVANINKHQSFFES